jgi:uncharacterized short protein YbdD (DUF466 family)
MRAERSTAWASATTRFGRVAARVAHAIRAVLGAPDYEAYLAHVRARTPGAAPLTREQFVEARMRARYERPGSRCC